MVETTRKINTGNTFFISGRDFDILENKEVRLLHLFNIKMKEKTSITSIENKNIPKINWVSGRENENVMTRILMPNGEWLEGLAEKGVKSLKVGEVIQFERFGFCKYDGRHKDIYEFWFGHK